MNERASLAMGALQIGVRCDRSGIRSATLRNTRPAIAPALRGLTAGEVCARVPRLFSLCAQAQAIAVRAACSAAAGATPDARAQAADERALAAENAREHLWRLMLDWPALLALPVALQADWRNRFAALHRGLAARAGADIPDRELAAGLQVLADELAAALPAALDDEIDPSLPTAAATALLPALDARACSRHLALDQAFAAAPRLDGACHETGALARHRADAAVAAALACGRRLAARILARIADLREVASVLAGEALPSRIDACSPVPGTGLACVDSARGLLIHQVQLAPAPAGAAPLIADYRIVAPTEWNFHPQGAFVREALASPPAAAPATMPTRRRLRALVLALDPCVTVSWAFEESSDA